MPELEEKVAIVTGAGSGIGRASAIEFAAEGAKVLAVDINTEPLEATARSVRDAGGEIVTFTSDVGTVEGVDEFVRAAFDAYGRVDILFNNAGVWKPGSIIEMPVEEFDRQMRINVRSVWLGMKAVLPGMIERRSGAIVNTASVNAFVANPNASAYTAAKHAVAGLTKSAAVEAGPYGVRVNAICPGPTETGILAAALDSFAGDQAKIDEALEGVRTVVPLKRIADPSEQAKVACFLASDRASYVNGECVLTDGGLIHGIFV